MINFDRDIRFCKSYPKNLFYGIHYPPKHPDKVQVICTIDGVYSVIDEKSITAIEVLSRLADKNMDELIRDWFELTLASRVRGQDFRKVYACNCGYSTVDLQLMKFHKEGYASDRSSNHKYKIMMEII